MDITKIYKDANAMLEGHFLLSSGKHSQFYLQSAKVLENPKVAESLAKELAKLIINYGLEVDLICSPALGGILAGYELARALDTRFIFAERVNGEMNIRRGFSIKDGERVLICEDIITTAGSAMEVKKVVESLGGVVVGISALANRGVCSRVGSNLEPKAECKIPKNIPLFALEDFDFEIYEAENCPLCATSKAVKPGSRGN